MNIQTSQSWSERDLYSVRMQFERSNCWTTPQKLDTMRSEKVLSVVILGFAQSLWYDIPILYQRCHHFVMFLFHWLTFVGESLWHDLHGASYAGLEASAGVLASHSAQNTE